jgi:hypothetical protein
MAHGLVDKAWNGIRETAMAVMKEIEEMVQKVVGWFKDALSSVTFGLFDSGGWLHPGQTVAANKTGRPEMITPLDYLHRMFRRGFDDWDKRRKHDDDWGDKIAAWWRHHQAQVQPPQPTLPPVVVRPPAEAFKPTQATLPTGKLGDVMQDVFAQLAPTLNLALQTGAGEQIQSAAQAILSNSARMEAISSAISTGVGGGYTVQDLTAKLDAYTRAAPPLPPATAISNTSAGGTHVAEGALQLSVTVQGNADTVTVKQLEACLNQFGDSILREVTGRT